MVEKPINKLSIIKEKDVPTFVREFNKNRATDEFLNSCKKAGKLFERKKCN